MLRHFCYVGERRPLRRRQRAENVAFPGCLAIVAGFVRGEDAPSFILARIRVPQVTTIDGLAKIRLHAPVVEGGGFCCCPSLRRVEAQFVG